jgi:hypothetical protein
MTGYGFHPEARVDLDEIWGFIRADNLARLDTGGMSKVDRVLFFGPP